MRSGRLREPRIAHRLPHRPLERLIGKMMATNDAGTRITRELRRRKDVLPGPLPACLRILARERIGQPDGAESGSEIASMQLASVLELFPQQRLDGARQNSDPVFVTFAVPDQYLASAEVDVLYPQRIASMTRMPVP